MMRSAEESWEILERALGLAGGDEADAVLESGISDITRFAGSTIHQNMSERSDSLTIRVVVEGRLGVASTSSLTHEEIGRAAAVARELASRSEPTDGFRGMQRVAAESPALETYDEETAGLSPMAKAEQLRRMFDRGRDAGVEFAGYFTTGASAIATANVHGVRRYAPVTAADTLIIALDGRESGFATACSRRATAIDIEALGDEATRRATLSGGKIEEEIEPGPWEVILEPPALAEVLEWMNMITLSGRAYEDGSSFFVGRLGKPTVGENVTLTDDPLEASFLPFPFDMEGTAKRRVPIIERGAPVTPVVDKLMADRLGIEQTASAAALDSDDHGTALHLSLAAGDRSVEEMIASTERGIWITRFNYVNGLLEPKSALMTGMTRDGTFLVQEGKVVSRLPNLRWTQSMVEALSNVVELGRDRRIVGSWWNSIGGTLAPAIKVRNWQITGAQKR